MQVPTAMAAENRLRAVDWLKGLAVAVMVQTHCMFMLRPELRTGRLYAEVNRLDGLVAPAFLFSSGCVLAWSSVVRGRVTPARTLARVAQVFAVGVALNLLWFRFQSPALVFRLDILPTLALSLAAAFALVAWLYRTPSRLMLAGAGAGLTVFFLAPLAEQLPAPWRAPLTVSNVAPFPLIPWAGYVLLGASYGAALGGTRSAAAVPGRNPLTPPRTWLAVALALCLVLWLLRPLWEALFPPHTWGLSSPAFLATKVGGMLLGLVALTLLEAGRFTLRPLDWASEHSLWLYVLHLLFIARPLLGVSFDARFRDGLDWLGMLSVSALLLLLSSAATGVLRPLWLTLRRRVLSSAQAS